MGDCALHQGGPAEIVIRWGGQLVRHDLQAGTFLPLSSETANLDTVSKYSAASAAELYAVSTNGKEILKFKDSTDRFEHFVDAPAEHTIKDLEAVAESRLWVVTTAGKVFAYSPVP